jgi:hypothetical protein
MKLGEMSTSKNQKSELDVGAEAQAGMKGVREIIGPLPHRSDKSGRQTTGARALLRLTWASTAIILCL